MVLVQVIHTYILLGFSTDQADLAVITCPAVLLEVVDQVGRVDATTWMD